MKYSKHNKIALFLLATILFMQSVLFPITTYASKSTAGDVQRAAQKAAEAAIGQVTAGGSGRVDSEGNEYEYYPGELYWAGTEERTTLLVYLVNNQTGQYIGNNDAIMLFQGAPIADTLLDSNGEPWLKKVTTKGGTIRCGEKNSAYAIFTNSKKWKDGSKYNMPAVASFIGNPDGVKNWLEETLDEGENYGITGLRIIDKIIINEMGYDAFKKTCPSESGDPEYAVVFESCSANMIYRNVKQDSQGVWLCTPDMNYSLINLQQNTGDPRAYYWGTPHSHAQWLMNSNSNGEYSPFASNAGVHSDIQTGSGKNGIENWKWYQSYFRYFGVTRDYWGGVIKGQKKKADELVTLGEAYSYGWAVGVAEPPHIPLGTCNDSTPGNTEEITEYTHGNKIIYKGYYTKKIHADGTSDIEDVKVFTRQGTTNWILLEAEDKNGYTMRCYKPSNSTVGLTATKNIRKQYSGVAGTSYGGVSSDTPINLNNVNGRKYDRLYILYEKVVDEEEDETLDGQFEIAESQISKRVSFADTSVTNTLNSHEFSLTAAAFDKQHDHINHTHGVGCYDADGKLTCTTPTTVKCTPAYTLGSKTIKFAIKFSNSDSYPSVIAKSDYVKTTSSTLISSTPSQNMTQSYTRGTTAQDTAKFSGFNQIALLFRGQDKLTLANWKNSSAGVEESFLTTIASNGTYNFKSSNAPQGSRKNKSYVETFSANWNTDTTVSSLQTSATCDGGSTGRGTTEYTSYTSPSIDYKIDNIKVNVKVFWAKAEKASTNTKVPEVASKLTAGAVSFRPYIKMRYDRNAGLADNRGFSKSNYVYVLAQSNSNMLVGVTANDYSNVSISGSADGAINISSTQFSTHNKAIEYIAGQFGVSTADVMNNMNHYKILPGGATFSISIPKDRTRTVTITTYQAYLPSGGAGYAQMQATGGSTTLETDTTKLVSNHKTFANAVRSTFAGTRIIQFVTTNTTDNLSSVLGGTAVKGGVSFAGVTLSSDSKYYFSNFSATNLDVSDVSEPSQAYYTFFVNTKGEVRCVQGTTVSGESDGQLIAAKGSDSVSGSGVAATIAKKTGIVTNLRQSLIDNVGNDTGAGWAPDGKWYNEAFDGITYLVQTSSFQIGMWNPTERQTVLDPKLTPAQSSKEDFFTNAYSTAFVSNNNATTVGTFRNSAGNSYSQKYNFRNLYNSEVMYIPNVTTQDLN